MCFLGEHADGWWLRPSLIVEVLLLISDTGGFLVGTTRIKNTQQNHEFMIHYKHNNVRAYPVMNFFWYNSSKLDEVFLIVFESQFSLVSSCLSHGFLWRDILRELYLNIIQDRLSKFLLLTWHLIIWSS